MVDTAHLTMVPGSVTVTQSRTSWGFELGRHRLSVTRSREARTIGRVSDPLHPRTSPRSTWPLAVGAFASISAFGLFVFGAVASEPLIPLQYARYSVSLPVPLRATKSAKDASGRKVRIAPPPASGWINNLSGPRFDAADEAYAVRAMRTGDFQEWSGADGQRRFLSTGPEQVESDRRCRDMALLIRGPDGSNRTRSARRCMPATSASHATPAITPDESASSNVAMPLEPSVSAEEDVSQDVSPQTKDVTGSELPVLLGN